MQPTRDRHFLGSKHFLASRLCRALCGFGVEKKKRGDSHRNSRTHSNLHGEYYEDRGLAFTIMTCKL
jgi:hypothetical protein